MVLDIPEELTLKLETAAKERGLSVGDFLQEMLESVAPDKQWATLADLARNAREAGLASADTVDTAGRSREILNTEYADYLKNRIDA